ncbi:conserved exported hypothetical protein [Candidatus Nitrospira nitrosa]|uniref:Multicopper oxidase n=1 Tax=Candidatus Nitrospira nitrosa TaxID=1742972 RepID=A0A0S4LPJ2_9BACT|nr:hypothetical protein [Candidatus Nitrospira nitrosa]CUS39491.1 conserved exported hypothetical protein [Candidatus Nitrospira nitrosa]
MTARSYPNLGVAVFMALTFAGIVFAEPPTGATAPVSKQINAGRAAHPEAGLNKPGVTIPGIIKPPIVIKPPVASCPADVLRADVVAIDHPMVFNRLGAQNVNWMMYALRHDLIDLKTNKSLDYSTKGEELFGEVVKRTTSRDIALRPDLRPRPLVLRVAEGGYLKVRFTNLLEDKAVPPHHTPGNPFNSFPDPLPNVDHPMEHAAKDPIGTPDDQRLNHIDDQVASRVVGFHPQGLELVRNIDDDSSYVGKNNNSLARPGETKEYCFFAPKEGAYLVSNGGAVFGGEGTAGNSGVGLFGAVAVQPKQARFYRAQVTEEEMRLATTGVTPTGQPVVNYEAQYPAGSPWSNEGKSGLPVLNMVQNNRIIHGDINAIIVGPNSDGSFPHTTYPIEQDIHPAAPWARNPTLPNRLEPFREFVSVFHDENAATQSYPYFFDHPELGHTLHGVRDAFMINYGSGGIGAEIIANRLHSGPMHDCLDCAYEEFFLSSFAVGDAAMIVDQPANMETYRCQPEFLPTTPAEKEAGTWPNKGMFDKFCVQKNWATEAYYPHDPANLHHSYIGDFVKFRNIHSGKEQHIFHLHNHQWLFNPNDDNSNYIDAQGLGPGSGYTYEIAFGGSGNRNKTVGDAIFHCHFYPHFAQGMWYMWRNHDVFEAGTHLAVSDTRTGYHTEQFGLMHGRPSEKARALPDGEIVAGTPIPAIVPLPGKGMAPMPVSVRVKPRIGDDSQTHGSVAEVSPAGKGSEHGNPGFPFWVAGVSQRAGQADPVSMGSRPTTPPLDMDLSAGGHNGGLPRHALAGYSSGGHDHSEITRFTATKDIEKAKPLYYDETGTPLEQLAMKFHAQRIHPTSKIDMSGVPSGSEFITNGAPPTPGAPYNDPCIDDKGRSLLKGQHGEFFGGRYKGPEEYFSSQLDLLGGIEFGGNNPRVYKGANLQLDVVFNKVGYHYPQQRILTLWEDVPGLLTRQRPPEPLVLRMNTYDCAVYQHTNLVPKEFYLDDYQITTPTDVIGQHIHLPKWDLTSADGGANGFNYEDGTFSPGAVRERIHAINEWNKQSANPVPPPVGNPNPLVPTAHPYFGKNPAFQSGAAVLQLTDEECKNAWASAATLREFEKGWGIPGKCDWLGARTTIQRWFSDPIVNKGLLHRGLGITFTHDHLGPSTHQQLGLYATMLTEPPNSEWVHNETGVALYTRPDGGPTTWQARIRSKARNKFGEILPLDVDKDGRDESHREFFLQFGDFQHAYEKGVFVGVDEDGKRINSPDTLEKDLRFIKVDGPGADLMVKHDQSMTESFRYAIHPSYRKPASKTNVGSGVPVDIFEYPATCPGGPNEEKLVGSVYGNPLAPKRPCPESISADDVGMMVVNYRNEPIASRVYDPGTKVQATGFPGDLAFAFQTRADRKIPELNTRLGKTLVKTGSNWVVQRPYPALTNGIFPGDPFTPHMRTYAGDLVKVKVQGGAHEHEHNGTINSLTWIQAGSGFGQAPHSGWRNSQNTGLSEQFTFTDRITEKGAFSQGGLVDRLYTVDTSQDGLWSGVWGILRSSIRRYQAPVSPLNLNIASLLQISEREEDLAPPRFDLGGLPKFQVAKKTNNNNARINSEVEGLKPKLLLEESNLQEVVNGIKVPSTFLQGSCPKSASVRPYHLVAVLANQVLDPVPGITIPGAAPNARLNQNGGTLVYNPRTTLVNKGAGQAGPLHDPTAILIVYKDDLDPVTGKLRADHPLEPVVLRAAAGECIRATLENRLPFFRSWMPDLEGYTSLSGIQIRDRGLPGSSMVSFNNNLIRPSNHIGLHPQMVLYDTNKHDGNNVGINLVSTVPPGHHKIYEWYAGTVERVGAHEECLPDPNARVVVVDLKNALTKIDMLRFSPFGTLEVDPQLLSNVLVSKYQDRILQVTGLSQSQIPVLQEAMSLALSTMSMKQDGGQLRQRSVAPNKRLGARAVGAEPKASVNIPQSAQLATSQIVLQDNLALQNQFKNNLNLVVDAQPQQFSTIKPRLEKLDQAGVFGELATELRILTELNPKGLDAGLAQRPEEVFPWQNMVLKAGFFNFDSTDTDFVVARKEPHQAPDRSKECRFVPVEFGATNLTPPDRIKQGQKGAVGALVVEPERSSWTPEWVDKPVDDLVADRQQAGQIRKSRATTTVQYPLLKEASSRNGIKRFRETVLVHQKGLNLRYANGDAVQSLAAEKTGANEAPQNTAPEDAHDSGQMAINYGTEPMWFRFGLSPDSPFGKEGFGGVMHAWQAFSNRCCDTGGTSLHSEPNVGDPYTPVATVFAGTELRVRALLPTGVGRATTFSLHGHNWARDPYLAEAVNKKHPNGPRHETWGVPAKCIGESALQMGMGGQESLTPMAHFDVVLKSAGGDNAVPGDYLWQDHGGFGITSGLWSIVRVVQRENSTNIRFTPELLRSSCRLAP